MGPPEPGAGSSDGPRVFPRVPFLGYPFEVRARGMTCAIRLRNLSCGGASGLCDEPLDVGSFVILRLEAGCFMEAEVRWVDRMNVGLKFTRPLAPAVVRRLHEAHGMLLTTRAGR
ncbi:PilZ domain-containing protein [Sphingomonas lenta]|uniref:PilZ domain-containing protein n=1 Tax=Sphingomonas lenta TaxID=1141887 RepID=A0A2A2SCD3_9SPHN|nr:PilZ domain-containing protein [Sphingomonas lenta]PAX06964.1 hypothetical protein CKY28_12915 [Sphingomonas lenta]